MESAQIARRVSHVFWSSFYSLDCVCVFVDVRRTKRWPPAVLKPDQGRRIVRAPYDDRRSCSLVHRNAHIFQAQPYIRLAICSSATHLAGTEGRPACTTRNKGCIYVHVDELLTFPYWRTFLDEAAICVRIICSGSWIESLSPGSDENHHCHYEQQKHRR